MEAKINHYLTYLLSKDALKEVQQGHQFKLNKYLASKWNMWDIYDYLFLF